MFKRELTIREADPTEWKEWDAFVFQQRDGTIFHSSIWLSEQPGLQLRIFFMYEGDQLVGGVPICVKQKMGIRILPQPLLTPYFGPVFSDEFLLKGRLSEALELILAQVYEPFDAFCFSLPPQAVQLRKILVDLPFYRENHRSVQNRRTNLKQQMPASELISSYPKMSRRNEIRRAMRKGTEARESEDFETIYRLSELSFQSTGRSHPLTMPQYVQLAKKMHQFGLGMGILTHSNDNIPLASAWILFDRTTTYNVLAGVDQEYKNYNGGSVALHYALTVSMEHGLVFDFGGSMIEGVNRYLQSYGTTECWYTHYRSTESSKMKLLKAIGLVRF